MDTFLRPFSAIFSDGDSTGVPKKALVQTGMTFRKPALADQRTIRGAAPTDTTDLWAIFRALRDAQSQFGLRAGPVQTLQAMLSCLKPGQGETVFASNAELCRRTGGIDERTLRRHVGRLVELGFITRHDSPNHKRYRIRSSDGVCLSFGLSVAPLLDRAEEILVVARQEQEDQCDRVYLRKKILTRLARIDEIEGPADDTIALRKTLRSKLSLNDYRRLWANLEAQTEGLSTAVDAEETTVLSANDGQNVRQHSKSEKEDIDKDSVAQDVPKSDALSLNLLTAVCKEACSFSARPIQTWQDAEDHARTLAPMMGIDAQQFQTATQKAGPWKTASALFLMLQMGTRVRNFAAYFQSLTTGRRAAEFDPGTLLNRMAKTGQALA
ncbi:MAG: plasmid replication protein RepC [Rhodobacterales bacterium]|uniref:plasmid replication protein RepC n=1 Tax=Puniceibacterium antarcticum TaxID=1206336 RepID=UPI001FEC4E01|nr:plasmid replication protein RepC [Puniceibacterium antarcticum]